MISQNGAYREVLDEIRGSGLYKEERILNSPQGVEVEVEGRGVVLNFCANNYLGLSNHPRLIAAAESALNQFGFGLSSVRFICGTQRLHKELERSISDFLGTDDSILYSSCFDANGGLFETILGPEDAVISDELNHASIIDGIRLCKARRWRYQHADMEDLEAKLNEARSCRRRLIATDGVFSMDGDMARLDQIVELAEEYAAMVMVDDSHATGVVGKTGRGTPEHFNVAGKIDIITSTLGKALGGASGGFTSGRREIIDLLRQRSRPYLFSNTLPPPLVGAGIEVFKILFETTALRDQLHENTRYFRGRIIQAGLAVKPGEHPIIPIMLHDARLAQLAAARLLDEGIYASGFFYPVVPQGQARIRVQISAAHEPRHLNQAVEAFIKVSRELKVIP